jgi:hypothetical protein
MALPSLIERNNLQNEKQTLTLLEDQNNSLKKIAQSLTNSEKEYSSLRKDMVELKKEFILGMNSFSEIKKYFEDMRSEKLNAKPIQTKEDNKSFFTMAISKLLGKKENLDEAAFTDLQRKILEETTIIKNLSLNTDENISIIRKSYEPAERAKERQLLAEAISEAIGGGSGSKGFMGIITALGISLAALGTYLVKGIAEQVGNIVSTVLRALGISKAISAIPTGGPGAPDTDKDKGKGKSKPTGGFLEGAKKFGGRVLKGLGYGGAVATVVSPSELGDSTMDAYKEDVRQRYEEGKLESQIDEEVNKKQFKYF